MASASQARVGGRSVRHGGQAGRRKANGPQKSNGITKKSKHERPRPKSTHDRGTEVAGPKAGDEVNLDMAMMDTQLVLDHMAQKTKRFNPDLSILELEEKQLPRTALADSTSYTHARNLSSLPAFLEHFVGGDTTQKKKQILTQATNSKGSPHTIVVTSSGLRAADVVRTLRIFQSKEAQVAKLFAKHIKLSEAIETTKMARMNIGVGTPQRLGDLLDAGALRLEALERVVVDASHVDQKKRGILDIKEVQIQLVDFLGRKEMRQRYSEDGQSKSSLKVLFF